MTQKILHHGESYGRGFKEGAKAIFQSIYNKIDEIEEEEDILFNKKAKILSKKDISEIQQKHGDDKD